MTCDPHCFQGKRFQHKRRESDLVKQYTYSTVVPDYHSPPGADIPPYGRPANAGSVPSPCGTAITEVCGGVGQKPCDAWPEPVPVAVWVDSGLYVDYSRCAKIGFKNVQAKKFWQGHWPFTHLDECKDTPTPTPGAPGCSCPVYEPIRLTPPQTKYLTATCSWAITNTGSAINYPGETASTTLSFTVSINRYSGEITLSGYSFSNVNDVHIAADDEPTSVAILLKHLTMLCGEWPDLADPIFFDSAIANANNCGYPDDLTDAKTLAGAGITRHIVFSYDAVLRPFCNNNVEATLSIEFDDDYTGDDAKADLYALLAWWDLSNDKTYKWRQDEYLTYAPLVTYNEFFEQGGFQRLVGSMVDGTWTDTAAAGFDGSIRGKPNDAGKNGEFDFHHIVYGFSNNDGMGGPCSNDYDHPYPIQYGDSVTNYPVPQNARQWTTNSEAGTLPPGAWFITSGGLLHAQKWAETYVWHPYQNFFRPCGADRDVIDQTTIICETTPAGTKRFPSAWPICGACKVSSATQNAGNVDIVLSTPAPYLRTSDHVDIANVPGLTAGNYSVTVVDSTHFSVVGTLSSAYIRAGLVTSHGAPDQIWNDNRSRGVYVLAQGIWNTRERSERARVRAWIVACDSGGPDNPCSIPYPDPSGDPAEYTQTNSQGCIDFKTCAPSVICISPNGEVFPVGTTIDFADVTVDERYEARWEALIYQHMRDLLDQTPHKECVDCGSGLVDSGCELIEDDGLCNEDDCGDDCSSSAPHNVRYYRQRPWVGALLELPAGAPALPVGVSFPVYALPGPVGFSGEGPATSITPWGIFLREACCVSASGRFAADYEANGVSKLDADGIENSYCP